MDEKLKKIDEALQRVSGHAKELLLIIKKELEDVAEAFATGEPPKSSERPRTSNETECCGCGGCHRKDEEETPTT